MGTGVTWRVAAVLLLMGLTFGGSGSGGRVEAAASGQLQTVRIALSAATVSNSAIYIAAARGYFEQQGIRIESEHLAYASQTMNVLSTNRIDVADVGVNPALFNGVAAGLGFKVVADKGSAPAGFGYTALVVRKDLADKIKGPADLKGRTIALTPPGLATATGYALATYLKRANLAPEDVHIQPIPFPEQVAALSNKSIDVAFISEPFMTRAIQQGFGVRLIGQDEIVPGQQIGTIAYASRFISERSGLGRAFMHAYVRAIRDYNAAFQGGIDKPAILEILAKATRLTDMKLWQAMTPAGLNPDGRVNETSISRQEEFFFQLHLIQDKPPLAAFIDNSFVQYASQVLGPARIP